MFSDGAVSLHTRSLKYRKLGQEVLVHVLPSLVKRQKTHFHDLTCGASVILGTMVSSGSGETVTPKFTELGVKIIYKNAAALDLGVFSKLLPSMLHTQDFCFLYPHCECVSHVFALYNLPIIVCTPISRKM